MDTLDRIAQEVRSCVRCRLAETRTFAVPGHGAGKAPLVLVAEAPGAKEDARGLPFQGLAGRFLEGQLTALGVSRDEIFITSTNKCRPPANRAPRPDEIAACAPYLDRQLALIRPRVVLAMGATAAFRLHSDARRGTRVEELRGSDAQLTAGTRLLVTFHPAAAMRFPARRQPFIDDLARACEAAGLAPRSPT